MTVTQIAIAIVVFGVGVLPFWAVHWLSRRRQQAQGE
jgi:hypothetical protein